LKSFAKESEYSEVINEYRKMTSYLDAMIAKLNLAVMLSSKSLQLQVESYFKLIIELVQE
jgi:hypothetical protein